MKSSKGSHQDEEEEAYEDFGSKKDTTPSTNPKDGRNSDKAHATRSKHSVTEQRRRSKINERYWRLPRLASEEGISPVKRLTERSPSYIANGICVP